MAKSRSVPAGGPAILGAALAAVVLALSLAITTPADAASRCGTVTVEQDGNEESAFNLQSRGMGCQPARRVVRKYLTLGDAPGRWALRTNPSSYTLYNGSRQVTFRLAS
jgi:hypothetical protein